MAHKHDHHDETYYLDQLCMIALCGAFAAIALALYFWQRPMLNLMVGPQFHDFVLWSGIALLVMVVMRAVVLWISVGREQAAGHGHTHQHDHDHYHHEHGPGCNHDHVHEHGAGCAHTHDHVHEHAHAVQAPAAVGQAAPAATAVQPAGQGVGLALPLAATHAHAEPHTHPHEHGHDHGHSHDFAPWRYMVMLVPVVLFLLGLPNKLPGAKELREDLTAESAKRNASVVGAVFAGGPVLLDNVVLASAVVSQRSLGKVRDISFKDLEQAAYTAEERNYWQGKAISVRGQFAPSRNPRLFTLVRFRINCCAADAIQLNVPILCDEPVKNFRAGDWVKVTGRIDFRVLPGRDLYQTILHMPDQTFIAATEPDTDPYIQ
jgi:hypothetical protein